MFGTKSLVQRQSKRAPPSIVIVIIAPSARLVQRQSRAKRPLRSTVPYRQPTGVGDHLYHVTGNAHHLLRDRQGAERSQGRRTTVNAKRLIPNRFQDEPNCPSPRPLPIGWGEGVRRTGEGQVRALLAELISG